MQVAAHPCGGKYYGIRIDPDDRARYFERSMPHVYISFRGNPEERFPLTASFWNSCIEIRGLAIRDWFKTLGYVDEDDLPNKDKWPYRQPPKLDLIPNGKGHFDLVP